MVNRNTSFISVTFPERVRQFLVDHGHTLATLVTVSTFKVFNNKDSEKHKSALDTAVFINLIHIPNVVRSKTIKLSKTVEIKALYDAIRRIPSPLIEDVSHIIRLLSRENRCTCLRKAAPYYSTILDGKDMFEAGQVRSNLLCVLSSTNAKLNHWDIIILEIAIKGIGYIVLWTAYQDHPNLFYVRRRRNILVKKDVWQLSWSLNIHSTQNGNLSFYFSIDTKPPSKRLLPNLCCQTILIVAFWTIKEDWWSSKLRIWNHQKRHFQRQLSANNFVRPDQKSVEILYGFTTMTVVYKTRFYN